MINGHDDGLRRAVRPAGTAAQRVLQQRAAAADHRPHRLHGQPPRRRVEPDGRRPAAPRRPAAARRPRQRGAAAAGAEGPDGHDPAVPQGLRPERAAAVKSIDRPTAELLAACVRARLNIVVSGGTASGKTTMLNALSAFVPDAERIITVEDAAELVLVQPHTVRLETAARQRRGPGPGHHPRPGPQLPAHAAGPHHRRRGPRRRGPRHAAGDEHRPRGLAGHRARQQHRRRPVPARDAGRDVATSSCRSRPCTTR